MSRAEKFLEGFKLGDLGAGKKKFVGDKPEHGEIVQQGFNTVFKKDDAPFVFWKEPDGWVYFYILEPNDKRYQNCHISIYAGIGMKPYYSQHSGWTIVHGDGESPWGVSWDTSDYKGHFAGFEKLISLIKSKGSFALLAKDTVHNFKPFSTGKWNYDEWLKRKRLVSDDEG
jgi:hypothetical protein